MKWLGMGQGHGVRQAELHGKKPKSPPRGPSGPKKYPDELVAHAKWLLQFHTSLEVAFITGLPPHYVGQLRIGVVRAKVQPKEMK